MFTAVTSALQTVWREISAELQQLPLSPRASISSASASSRLLPAPPSRSPINQEFIPSPHDVQHTRLLLVRGLDLPVEIVDMIIDAAQYWPAVIGTTTSVGGVSLRSSSSSSSWTSGGGGGAERGERGPMGINFGGSGVVRASDTRRNKAAQLVVATGAVPADEDVGGMGKGWEGLRKIRVKSVRWRVKSRDQGWVSSGAGRRGTYHGSSSWFDACILRPLPASTPRPPLAPDVAARIDLLQQRFGPPPGEPFPTFLVGNLLSHDPEDARDFLRSLGWDFVERVERVEVDGEVGERRGVLWKLQANVVASAEYHVHDGEWWRRNEHWFPGWVNDVDDVNVEIRYSV
ncbi:uncharacterized protein LTHEOB_6322 [Lasiodiplodia theobromae]|uniref:Uncharacterized protein n=1 Tax=Lasiodiplodia theobromae TaxID=45133 RepID=A0A5N5DKR4_9PEZI|nr:uncharacterized protein LTHEOB_6322 [Lasiodiplodia theobromae]KAB2578190.1 hypothetical protein DBV05_g3290 [Lasiodiplodia theobromae]KAF4544204.1 hypothetical protein LTHEOB_6322 [Lasiodiplodia theobromae]